MLTNISINNGIGIGAMLNNNNSNSNHDSTIPPTPNNSPHRNRMQLDNTMPHRPHLPAAQLAASSVMPSSHALRASNGPQQHVNIAHTANEQPLQNNTNFASNFRITDINDQHNNNNNSNSHPSSHRTVASSNKSASGIKKLHSSRKSVSTLSLDLRRVKKIEDLKGKIKCIDETRVSKKRCRDKAHEEYSRAVKRVEGEKSIQLEACKTAREQDITEYRRRYTSLEEEIQKDNKEKTRTLQLHCLKELAAIRKRALQYKRNNEKAIFSVVSIKPNPRPNRKGRVIRISMKRRYSSKDIDAEIANVFANWQNEINFNVKRATRLSTKNKKGNRGQNDLSRIRFHLKEEQIKQDLRELLDAEHKYDTECNRKEHLKTFGLIKNKQRKLVFGYRCDEPRDDFDAQIKSACYQLPSYSDKHHISGISTKLGFLNDPDIGDPLYSRSRRARTARVNYQLPGEEDVQNMYHSQEVHFFVSNASQKETEESHAGDDSQHSQLQHTQHHHNNHGGQNGVKTHYKTSDGHEEAIPVEEIGNNVIIGGFTIGHGCTVRINYNTCNTTVDARVVSITKNQLYAVTLVGHKRKRIWYKELRSGKINIVPATAYR